VSLPSVLANRRGDNWRPLFRIAHLAGGHWPATIETAALAAMGQTVPSDVIIAFLTDTREIIGEREHILSTELIDALRALEDPSWDWNGCNRGGPITTYWLRDKLADVLIPPGTKAFRAGSKTRRGYEAGQFHDAYERYLQQHNPSLHRAPEPETHTESSGKTHRSDPSATGTNDPRKTLDISVVADAPNTPEQVSATELNPQPAPVGSCGSSPIADADSDRSRHPQSEKSAGDTTHKSNRLRTDRINGGKSPLSHSIPPEPTSAPQPEGEEVDELW
jgi:hypothetical protein